MNIYPAETIQLVDTRKKLGFRINDHVRLTKKFFSNHGEKYIDIGIGVVYGKHMPDENSLPSIIVQFPMNTNVFSCKLLFDMLFIRSQNEKGKYVLMSIHPMYLEQVEAKRAKGTSKKTGK